MQEKKSRENASDIIKIRGGENGKSVQIRLGFLLVYYDNTTDKLFWVLASIRACLLKSKPESQIRYRYVLSFKQIKNQNDLFSELKHSLHNKQSTLIFESWESLELLLHWCISLFSRKKTDRQRQRAVPFVLTVTSKLGSESQLSAGKRQTLTTGSVFWELRISFACKLLLCRSCSPKQTVSKMEILVTVYFFVFRPAVIPFLCFMNCQFPKNEHYTHYVLRATL